ncbi:MAG: hypothetical protein RLZZ501_2536 [Pseudomonadota bacterium]
MRETKTRALPAPARSQRLLDLLRLTGSKGPPALGGRGRSPLWVLLALLLSACAEAPPPPVVATVAPGVTLALAAAGRGEPVEVVQLVAADHGDDTFLLEARLSAGPGRLLLVGTDPMGRRAMRLDWHDGRLEIERAPWVPEDLPPANVLADLMLLFWPAELVRDALAGAELIEDGDTRLLRRDGQDLVVVRRGPDPWEGEASLDHRLWHYHLSVQSHRVAP